jgi:hypothetical protein
MNIGWIKLHRQFKDWEWYNKSEMVHLFIHCLIKSNFKEGNFQGIEVEKGSFITSLKHLSDETNISVQTIRTCLKKLQLTKEIDVKSTNKLTKITICKYESYQLESETSNKQLTNNQQTTNKQLTTTKEYKENKKDKEEKNMPDFQSFLNHALTKEPNIDEVELKKKYDAWVNNNWHDGNGKKIIIWKTKLNSTIPYISKKQSKQEVDQQFFKITL